MARMSSIPVAVKTIGAVITVCSSRLDTRLYKNTSTTKAAIVTMVPLLLEVAVVQGECHPAYVFREKRTGVPIHQKSQFGPLGEHL
jgi:hypothetical protein